MGHLQTGSNLNKNMVHLQTGSKPEQEFEHKYSNL